MHDQNFKNLILDYPRQALEFFAAEESGEGFANTRILPVRQEQLMERLGERFRELDVPLIVEWPDGRSEAILFVIEEETEPNRFSIHRLAHYMDYPSAMRIDVYAAAHGGLATLESNLERQRKYIDFIDYYANLNAEEINRYRECHFREKGELMGLAQILRDEGMQQGMQQGMQLGEQSILERQLARRFAPLPEWVHERLVHATIAQMEQWADLVLEADSLEGVLGPKEQ